MPCYLGSWPLHSVSSSEPQTVLVFPPSFSRPEGKYLSQLANNQKLMRALPAIIVPLRASHVHPFSSINEPKMVLPTNHHSPCLSPLFVVPPSPSIYSPKLLVLKVSNWHSSSPSLANNMYITLLFLLPPPTSSYLLLIPPFCPLLG